MNRKMVLTGSLMTIALVSLPVVSSAAGHRGDEANVGGCSRFEITTGYDDRDAETR